MSQASRVLEGRSLQVRKADLLPYVAQLLRPKETQVSYRCSASSSCFTEIGKLLRIMSETRREMAGAIRSQRNFMDAQPHGGERGMAAPRIRTSMPGARGSVDDLDAVHALRNFSGIVAAGRTRSLAISPSTYLSISLSIYSIKRYL